MRNRLLTVFLALLTALALEPLGASAASAQEIYVQVPPPPRVIITPPRLGIRAWRMRVRWQRRRARAQVVVMPPAPPSVVAAAPPAPVYYYTPAPAPLPPIPPPLVAPAPYYAPVYYAPPPEPTYVAVRRAPKVDGWRSRVGLGVRGIGVTDSGGWDNLGIGGEFLVRATNHLSLELAAEYQHDTAGGPSGAVDRIDIPATIGMRIYLGPPRWVVSPYFVFAAGFDYAAEDLRPVTDQAYYFDGQLGGGLELRLGQHVALTADVRFDGKKRLDSPADPIVAERFVTGGHAASPLGDEYGAQFRLGVALYF
jgi:hypothetical protein